MSGQPQIAIERFRTIADGLDHPECVAAGPDGMLYAGGEGGQIYRIADGVASQIATTGGFVLGLCLDAESAIYACDQARHEVVRIADGRVESYSGTIGVPNYPVFADDGTLFVSDSGSWDGHDGTLWSVAPGGATSQVDVDVRSFPNGLAIDPTGAWLYIALSNLPGIVRVPLDGSSVAGAAETVIELPGTVPDGLAFTSAGDLLVSCYAPDTIYRFDGHSLSVLAHDPRRVVLASPTNLAFHGPTLDDLAVGSLARWHISSAAGLIGARLRYPAIRPIDATGGIG